MKVIYTPEQKKKAIQTFKKLKSYTKTIRVLGYPSLHVLHDWVKGLNHKKPVNENRYNFKHYSWSLKYDAVIRVESGEDIADVASDLGVVNYASIYAWIRRFKEKGTVGLMSKKEQIEAGIYKTKAQLKKDLPDDISELKELAADLLAEKAVLEKELELAKKDPGGIPEKLPPKIKSKIVYSLKDRLPLELLFKVLALKRSSYYYFLTARLRPDKYAYARHLIHVISEESGYTYGSPRIWICLRRRNLFISEKVVRRLMKEENIEVRYASKKKTWSSYMGEITPSVRNIVKGNFHASQPNTLWLTDITQFAASDGKVYLSPMIDCYDGKVVAWSTSRNPDNALVESMLTKSLDTLSDKTKAEIADKNNKRDLIIHTDRGGHYRGGMWIDTLRDFGIQRSMSRKGNSGDNAACEGFFGRMKTEMYYGIKWESAAQLEEAIHSYLDFYNNTRIKMSLGGMSIKEYRMSKIMT